MRKIKFKLLVLLLLVSPCVLAQINFGPIDTIDYQGPPIEDPPYKVTNLNLTGNFEELVISVGFPDLPSTINFPTMTVNQHFPKLGVFPNGTLLENYIISQGGSISIDEWWEPMLDYYFDIHSGGQYTANFDYVKNANGQRYLTTSTMADFIILNGGSSNNVV